MNTIDNQNIEHFFIVGINYKKTDTAVRGIYAISPDQYSALLSLAPSFGIRDFFILSTCNRTEIYGFAESAQQLAVFLCSVGAGNPADFLSIGYVKNGYEAATHLFQVAAGLDSQILGDFEILGQIKAAVKQSKAAGCIGSLLERLLNCAMQSSKSVKTNTSLSGGTVSVSFAAVQYIKEFLKLGEGSEASRQAVPKIVLVGTGKIGRSTCRNLVDYLDTKNITLMNRTEATAAGLAGDLGLQWAPMDQLTEQLSDATIVVVSTNSEEPVILAEHLQGAGGKLVLDLSVPCNVAMDARQLAGISFVDVDTLSRIKDETLQNRRAEVPKAEALINDCLNEFKEWYGMRRHVPVLKEVKDKLKGLYVAPLLLNSHAYGRLQEQDEERIQKVINSMATKMRRKNTLGCHYIEAINDFIG